MNDLAPGERRALRRAARRLQHRSRSAAVSVALAIVALAALYVAVEAVLAALGRPPLAVAPGDLWRGIASPPAEAQPWLIAGAVVAAALGLTAIVLAVAPGSLHRRPLADDERAVIVVDDAVLAGGLSRAAGAVVGVGRGQATTAVTHRGAHVTLRPSSGFRVDERAAEDAATGVVARVAPSPAPRVRVTTTRTGALS